MSRKSSTWKDWQSHLQALGYDLSRSRTASSGHEKFYCSDPECPLYFTDSSPKDANSKGILPCYFSEAKSQLEKCTQFVTEREARKAAASAASENRGRQRKKGGQTVKEKRSRNFHSQQVMIFFQLYLIIIYL